ncbi:hypothetical protein ES707_13450 [subsurface metagenome]
MPRFPKTEADIAALAEQWFPQFRRWFPEGSSPLAEVRLLARGYPAMGYGNPAETRRGQWATGGSSSNHRRASGDGFRKSGNGRRKPAKGWRNYK